MKKSIIVVCLTLIALFSGTISWGVAVIPPDLKAELLTNKKLAQENPTNADLWFDYAMSCAYTGQVDEGLDALKKVDDIDHNYAKKMTPVFRSRVKEDPDNWRNRFYYAFSVYALTIDRKKSKVTKEEARKYQQDAFSQFKEVTRILGDKNYVTAWSYGYMAAILGEQEKFDEAIKYLRKGLKIEPDGIYLHIALGYAYMKRGNLVGVLAETLTVGKLRAEEQRYNQQAGQDKNEPTDY